MKRTLLLLSSVAILFATMFSSCKKDDPNSGNSRMLFVHASPDAPAVDVLIDNSKINSTPVSYPNNTSYATVSAGTRNIKINPAGTTTTALEGNITIEKDKAYSVYAINRLASIAAIATEDNLTAPASGKAHIRFLHLSPGSPNVTVGTLSGSTFTALYTNRSFETQVTANAFAGFTPIDAGTYTFEVRVAGTTSAILTAPGVVLQAGKIYTIIARGVLGSTSTPVGASVVTHN
jgi:hypothetical protein